MASSEQRLNVKRGASIAPDVDLAVAELREQISQPDMSGVLFFCSPVYDLERLGPALKAAFPCPVTGCTTAGEITSDGYLNRSIVAASLSSSELVMHPVLISPLAEHDSAGIKALADETRRHLRFHSHFDKQHMFNLLLVDGMSMLEEQLTALVYHTFNEVPLIGGSAGDELEFKQTHVYHDGCFLTDAAVVTLFETMLPFLVFKSQHFQASNQRLVISGADPARRIVTEINGRPAASEYAALIGVNVDELTPAVFSNYPVLLRIGGQYYIRSIQQANADGSLTFYCAIDTGLVLRVALSQEPVKVLAGELSSLYDSVPNPQLIIGCDCILRRLELQSKGLDKQLAALLSQYSFIGFSTYGEQYNSVHVNQTITGVVIGG